MKYLNLFLCLLLVAGCRQVMLPGQSLQDKEVAMLSGQLIYLEETEVRIKALKDLTGIGIKVRYNAINDFLKAAKNYPELFPRDDEKKDKKGQSLLMEIIRVDYLNENKAPDEKEYMNVRMLHLKMMNKMLELTIKNRMYYETAELCFQKYLYGTLWSQEALSRYKNRPRAAEFERARNAGVVYLQLLLDLVGDERSKNLIIKYLEQVDRSLL